MPSITRLIRLATLPETRHLIAAAHRSDEVRRLARRARSDRAGLLRELADPRKTARLIRQGIAHPATLELANVGIALMPVRYLPVGWVATRLFRRSTRRGVAGSQGSPESEAAASDSPARGRGRASPSAGTLGVPPDLQPPSARGGDATGA